MSHLSLATSVVSNYVGFHETQDIKFQDYNSDAKIIVTSNPDPWEGDSRTFEALSTGALVFVDYTESLQELIPHPFVNGTHLIVYYHGEYDTLGKLIEYYLEHAEEREAIARSGYMHVMNYHRAEHRLDYVLDKALPYVKAHAHEPRNTVAYHPYADKDLQYR